MRDIEIGDKVMQKRLGDKAYSVIDIADSVFGGRILHLEPGDQWINATDCTLIEEGDDD